jgi:hypothetical protein
MAKNSESRHIRNVEEEQFGPLTTIIKTEANLAGLPFFALSRQDVRERVETEYRVSVERDGKQLDVA